MTADPSWGGVGAGGLHPSLQAQATRLGQCDGEKAEKERESQPSPWYTGGAKSCFIASVIESQIC